MRAPDADLELAAPTCSHDLQPVSWRLGTSQLKAPLLPSRLHGSGKAPMQLNAQLPLTRAVGGAPPPSDERLREFNVRACILHLCQGVLMLVASLTVSGLRDFTTDVTTSFLAYDAGARALVHRTKVAGSVNIGVLAMYNDNCMNCGPCNRQHVKTSMPAIGHADNRVL